MLSRFLGIYIILYYKKSTSAAFRSLQCIDLNFIHHTAAFVTLTFFIIKKQISVSMSQMTSKVSNFCWKQFELCFCQALFLLCVLLSQPF